MFIGNLYFVSPAYKILGILENTMQILQNKKTFLFLLLLSFLFNFLPSYSKSNFKPPGLNTTDFAFNGPVNAIVRDEMTGIVYIGGQFTQVGQNFGAGVPIDISTGTAQSKFPKVIGIINAITSDDHGGWYIGGAFRSVGGIPRDNLAHILSDGTVDLNWNPRVVSFVINALAISGSTIYIGGSFTKIGDVERNNLAAIGIDGTLQSWNPNVKGRIDALAISGSTIYVGGLFTKIGDVERNNLAAIGIDGTLLDWSPRITGTNITPTVNTLKVSGSTVYIGGYFTRVNEKPRNNLAAIGIDGTLLNWNPSISNDEKDEYGYIPSSVETLEVNGSTVYIGGYFTHVNEKPRNNLAAIGIDGTLLDWNPNITGYYDDIFTPPVKTLAISGSTIYVGGEFNTVGDVERNNLAAVGIDGTLLSWDPNISDSVNALAISGSTVYAGGKFSTVGGVERKNLVAIGTNGTLLDWSPSVKDVKVENDYSSVNALAISGSTIYVGGEFSAVDGVERKNLAAIDTNGTLLDWSPSVGMESGDCEDGYCFVNALAISGSTVYVGGEFSAVDGIERKNLAAIDTNGTLFDWSPSVDVDDNDENYTKSASVKTLGIKGSIIYVGGFFDKVNNIRRKSLAAIGKDGALKNWNPNFKSNYSLVNSILIKGSTVYFGGLFNIVGKTKRNNIAAIRTSGVIKDWNPNIYTPDVYSGVKTLAISGSTIYVGGNFTKIGDVERNNLAAIGIDGTLQSWNPNVKGRIDALAISDSAIYVGGYFTSIDNEPRSNFASFNIPK